MFSVGSALNPASQCVPFVSQYTDCTEENRCSGCTRCHCSQEGRWSCSPVQQCGSTETDPGLDGRVLDNALETLLAALKPKGEPDRHQTQHSHRNKYDFKDDDDEVLEKTDDVEKEILSLFQRTKRAIDSKVKYSDATDNGTVKFHHTVDEINEDTLKNNNSVGTIKAKKFETNNLAKLSRRSQPHIDNTSALHIEYNDHTSYNPHETDNKIDSNNNQYKLENTSRNKEHTIFNNFKNKDKDLSKLVVNELKKGIEYIGDRSSPVTSNITFTPEKDTLTAMAFIAGNLLNKLWSIEKDNGEDPMETEVLKHEKIADLIALFKEPLSMRQAMFLKNALEQISKTVDNPDTVNETLCANLERVRLEAGAKPGCDQRKMIIPSEHSASENAVSKVGDVLKLVKKFETVNVKLENLKDNDNPKATKASLRAGDDDEDLNQFGTILEKITKLLMPDKKRRKATLKKIQNLKTRPSSEPIQSKLKDLFNIEPDTLNISPKDKLLFSYLSKMEKSPKCLLDVDTTIDASSKPVGGDIILNLSEFFKVKSLVDLLKVAENKPEVITTEAPVTVLRREYKNQEEVPTGQNSLTQTRARLKSHLKSILEDIAELQNASGANKDKNYKVSDILPCVYKLLQDSQDINQKEPQEDKKVKDSNEVAENLRKLFHSIKQQIKLLPGSRRLNEDESSRPKSAIVWERTVKSLDENNQQPSRRHLDLDEPKQFYELKTMIDAVKSLRPNSTMSDAVRKIVPPSEKLVLYKTLESDARHNIDMLKRIKESLDSQTLRNYQITELGKFVDDASTNLDSIQQVLDNIDNAPIDMVKKPLAVKNEKLKMPTKSIQTTNRDNKVKFTRDQLLNQLMKNRVERFLKNKEGSNLGGDTNLKIAQRIRNLIRNGSYSLARKLFKTFVTLARKPAHKSSSGHSVSNLDLKTSKSRTRPRYSRPTPGDQESPDTLATQEQLLNQLLSFQDQAGSLTA